MTKHAIAIVLFVAHYSDSELSITQRSDGQFFIYTSSHDGIEEASTTWDDVVETISEVIEEANDFECTFEFKSDLLRKQYDNCYSHM